MAKGLRTFIAAEVSDEIRSQTERVVDQLASPEDGVNWVSSDNLHLTFKFLGEVPDVRLHEICRSMASVTADFPPILFECGGVGAFPDLARPRTLWVGVSSGGEALELLHRALEDAMADLRFPREHRRFHPHLTIGRLRDSRRAAGLADRLQAVDESHFGSAVITQLVLFSSQLTRSGPIYTPVGRAKLG